MAIFTTAEMKAFCQELKSKLVAGIRAPFGVLYLFIVLGGVALASFKIPEWNGTELSPETLGIYVIGILVAVLADSIMMMFKSYRDDKLMEVAVAVVITLTSLLLIYLATIFSMKSSHLEDSKHILGDWRPHAKSMLALLLFAAVLMSLILTGYDSKIDISALDRPPAEVADRS